MDVPPRLQGELFAKVLTFDRSYPQRCEGGLVVAIAYQSGNRVSRAARDGFLAGFRAAASASNAQPIRFVDVDYSSPQQLRERLVAQRVSVLYVAPLRSVEIQDIFAVTRALKVLTLAGDGAYVRQGVSVGARLKGERPVILINSEGSRLEGSSFSSQLLRLAEVVE